MNQTVFDLAMIVTQSIIFMKKTQIRAECFTFMWGMNFEALFKVGTDT